MKKIFLGIATSFCLLQANFLADDKVQEFNELDFFKKINAKVVNVFDSGSLYILDIKVKEFKDVVFLTKDKKALVKGMAVDIINGKNIDLPIKDIGIAKGKEAFSIGKGKDEYYVFTDPQCPYCKELEKYFPQLIDKTKINIFYYPLVQIHPEASDLSMYQMYLAKTSKNKLDVLRVDVNDNGFANRKYDDKTKSELEEKLKEQMKVGEEFGIQGTPTIISKDGERLSWFEFVSKYNIPVQQN